MSHEATLAPSQERTAGRPGGGTAAPLNPAAFAQLAGEWQALDVQLSLWNGEAAAIPPADGQDDGFWGLCWRRSSAWRDALRSQVVTALDATKGAAPAFHPLRIDSEPPVGVIVPLRRRRKLLGACVAMLPLDSSDAARIRRWASRFQLDADTLIRTARPSPSSLSLTGLGEVLAGSLARLVALETGAAELVTLTENLDAAYEELSLGYRLGPELRLNQPPRELLGRVLGDVLAVSRVRHLAIVSEEAEDSPSPSARSVLALRAPVTRELRVVAHTAGGQIDQAQLARLARQLFTADGEAHGARILNDISARPELSWAASWLRHCLAIPLGTRGRRFGLMLAINCRDDGDFSSVDTQLLRAVADRLGMFLENRRLYADLEDLMMGIVRALVSSIDAKDAYTCGHSERVAFLSRRIAEAAGVSEAEAERTYLAGLVHDVGKIGVADAILCKPGKLTDEEFTALKKHPQIGARILSTVPQIADLIPGVIGHHERYDGRGYPHGVAGEAIPLLARIVALADGLDAMTTTRTYRSFLPPKMAMAEVRRCSGTQFDPRLADLLLQTDLVAVLAESHAWAGSAMPVTTVEGAVGAA